MPFIGSSDINAMRERQIKGDFAYNSNMKVIWDKKKGALDLNQSFNVFNVIRPTDPVNNRTIDSVLGTSKAKAVDDPSLQRPGWSSNH